MVGESQSGAMGQPAAARSRGGFLRRKRFLIVGLVVAAAMGYLGYTAFMGAATYYLTVGELMARGSAVYGQEVRLMGKTVEGSVQREAETNTIRFTIADRDGGTALPVVYSGTGSRAAVDPCSRPGKRTPSRRFWR